VIGFGLAIDLPKQVWHDFATFSRAWRPIMSSIAAETFSPTRAENPPPSLPRWLPYLWSRVLFPGRASPDTAIRATALLLLLILPSVLLYPCMSFRLFEPDEGRYAEIAREMTARNDWVVPMLQGEPYLDKPPLLYWLTMLSYHVFGIHEWSARLAPALAVHCTILAVYLIGRRSLGERAAYWGAMLLSLAPGFVGMGRLLIIDGLLTLWVTLSILAAFEAIRGESLRWSWWAVSACACGLGILTKGPIALVLLIPPVMAHFWLTCPQRKQGQPLLAPRAGGLNRVHVVAYAFLVIAVLLPWHIALGMRVSGFFTHFFWRHNVLRFLSPFDHLEPIWYYVPVLIAGLLPGTLFLVMLVRFLLSGARETAEQRCPELGFFLLAGGWCLLFFTASGSKLPTYILPAFPPLALALGYCLSVSRLAGTRRLITIAGASYAILLVAHFVLVPWYANYRSPVARYDELAGYFENPDVPVICFPRTCDSVGFYFERDDLRGFRSHDIEPLRAALRQSPRTVVLCTHRHSLAALREALPPELQIKDVTHFGLMDSTGLSPALDAKLAQVLGETALGLCDAAVVEAR
jgi:4-amino-4-deoxy-L-arabinose transferase-like glycosyltransferase